jgi:hypothetical protein
MAAREAQEAMGSWDNREAFEVMEEMPPWA